MNDKKKPHDDQHQAPGATGGTPRPANDDHETGMELLDDEVLEVGGDPDDADIPDDENEFLDGDGDGGDDDARIAELEGQVSDLTDRLLRTAAEMENVRKTAQKDRENASKFATTKFAEDMLAVADNLSRALEAVGEDERKEGAAKGLVEGVELTMRELNGALERHGITAIEAMGARFDPNLHQAMFEAETADFEPGMVMQVLRTGYTIHGRLLRPAMVGVAKAPATPGGDGASEG